MKFTATQIAGILNGEVDGDAEVEVSQLSKIEEGTKGSLTFLANPKYTSFIYSTEASITIVDKDFHAENDITTTLIRVDDAYKAFSQLLEYYNQVKMNKTGIEQPVFISESARFDEATLYLGAFSYVGDNVTIGENVKISKGTNISNSVVGDKVEIVNPIKIIDSVIFSGEHLVTLFPRPRYMNSSVLIKLTFQKKN